jgi:hypothetical protein
MNACVFDKLQVLNVLNLMSHGQNCSCTGNLSGLSSKVGDSISKITQFSFNSIKVYIHFLKPHVTTLGLIPEIS